MQQRGTWFPFVLSLELQPGKYIEDIKRPHTPKALDTRGCSLNIYICSPTRQRSPCHQCAGDKFSPLNFA